MAIGQNGSYFQMYLDQIEVPLENMKFSEVLISSHILYRQPIGHIKFTDPSDLMSSFNLQDGVKLTFKLGASKDRVFLYEYRVYNVKKEKLSDNQHAYTISFVDIFDIWRLQSSKASIKGTSKQALEKIAKYCTMTFQGVDTTDEQVWLPMAEPYCDFSQRIKNSGYASPSSCMALAVNMYGQLTYVDINAVDISKAKMFRYGSDQAGAIPVIDISFKNDSGAANSGGGYKQTNNQFSVKDGKRKKSSKVETRRLSEGTNLNKEVSGKVGDGKIKHLPVDSGNNHENSLKARNQNARIPLLLSTRVSLLTMFDPDLELLQPAMLEVYDKQGKLKSAESGLYVVAGKAIIMNKDFRYLERYELIRDGSNAQQASTK